MYKCYLRKVTNCQSAVWFGHALVSISNVPMLFLLYL